MPDAFQELHQREMEQAMHDRRALWQREQERIRPMIMGIRSEVEAEVDSQLAGIDPAMVGAHVLALVKEREVNERAISRFPAQLFNSFCLTPIAHRQLRHAWAIDSDIRHYLDSVLKGSAHGSSDHPVR